jgi:hypothetical protein
MTKNDNQYLVWKFYDSLSRCESDASDKPGYKSATTIGILYQPGVCSKIFRGQYTKVECNAQKTSCTVKNFEDKKCTKVNEYVGQLLPTVADLGIKKCGTDSINGRHIQYDLLSVRSGFASSLQSWWGIRYVKNREAVYQNLIDCQNDQFPVYQNIDYRLEYLDSKLGKCVGQNGLYSKTVTTSFTAFDTEAAFQKDSSTASLMKNGAKGSQYIVLAGYDGRRTTPKNARCAIKDFQWKAALSLSRLASDGAKQDCYRMKNLWRRFTYNSTTEDVTVTSFGRAACSGPSIGVSILSAKTAASPSCTFTDEYGNGDNYFTVERATA